MVDDDHIKPHQTGLIYFFICCDTTVDGQYQTGPSFLGYLNAIYREAVAFFQSIRNEIRHLVGQQFDRQI